MKEIVAFCKGLLQFLLLSDYGVANLNYWSSSPKVVNGLPQPVIDTIKNLKSGNDWIWSGEFFHFLEEPYDTWEIMMYTKSGAFRSISILKNGEIDSIFPTE